MCNNKMTIYINKIMYFLLYRHYALDSFSRSQAAVCIADAKDLSVKKGKSPCLVKFYGSLGSFYVMAAFSRWIDILQVAN